MPWRLLRTCNSSSKRGLLAVEGLEQRLVMSADSSLSLLSTTSSVNSSEMSQAMTAVSLAAQSFQISQTESSITTSGTISVNSNSFGSLQEQSPGSLSTYLTGSIPVLDNGTSLSIRSGASIPLANINGSFQPGDGPANIAGSIPIGIYTAYGAFRNTVLTINQSTLTLNPDGTFSPTGIVFQVQSSEFDYSIPGLLPARKLLRSMDCWQPTWRRNRAKSNSLVTKSNDCRFLLTFLLISAVELQVDSTLLQI